LEEVHVEPHARLRDVEHQLVVDIRHDCLASIDPHSRQAFCLSFEVPIVTGTDGVQVGRNSERLGENKALCTFNLEIG